MKPSETTYQQEKQASRKRKEQLLVFLYNGLTRREMAARLLVSGLMACNGYRAREEDMHDEALLAKAEAMVRLDLFRIRKRFRAEDSDPDLDRHVYIQRQEAAYRKGMIAFENRDEHPAVRSTGLVEAMKAADRAALAKGVDIRQPQEVEREIVYDVRITEEGGTIVVKRDRATIEKQAASDAEIN